MEKKKDGLMIYPIKRRKIRFSKYHSVTCHCNQDHTHDSRGEAGYCNQLELLKKANEIKNYGVQITFPLKVNGKEVCRHRVDFIVYKNDGKCEVNEYKGFATQLWNLKRKLFEACYPQIPYIVIRHGR